MATSILYNLLKRAKREENTVIVKKTKVLYRVV